MAIFLITAPSGTGKTTIAQYIAKGKNWEECISHTTRPMREGEVDGKTYYFIDEQEFIDLNKMDGFAEKVKYDGNYYGASKDEIQRVMSKGKHVYIIVEYNGYKQIKELFPEAVGLFLWSTKEECMANMLLRGDSLDKSLKRISTYEEEMKNRDEFDYVIKNNRGHFNATCGIVLNILSQYDKKIN